MVVWTAANRNTWFTSAAQMGLSVEAYQALQDEGITAVDDLAEFDEKQLKEIAKNLRQGQVAGGNPVVLKAGSLNRLTVSANLMRYYKKVGRDTSPQNVSWQVGKNFKVIYEAIQEQKDEDPGDVPKLNAKTATPLVWSPSFKDHLGKQIGRQGVPLTYVIQTRQERPDGDCPPVANGKPHAKMYRSLKEEAVDRASHDHPMYLEDNEKVFNQLEEATCGTKYATVAQPHQWNKDC